MRSFPRFLLVLAAVSLPRIVIAQESIPLTYWQAPVFFAPGTATHSPEAAASGRRALALSSGPLPFIAVPPCRLVDTRGNAPLTGGFLPSATVRSYTLAGVCGVPANAEAISLNATVVKPIGPGFLVLWPQGGTLPPVSTLNYAGNDIVANAAIVPLSSLGGLSMVLGVSGGDVVLDTNGYYASFSNVSSVNTLTGDVLLQAGANTSITPSGNTLTISSSGGLTGITAGTGIAVTGGAPSPTVSIPPAGIQADRIASAQVVKDVNGLKDSITLAAGSNTTLTPSGNTITIGSAGTVTGVIAGTGLTGGGTGGTFSLGIANGGVNTPQLADNAVTAPKIASGQVVKSLNGLNDAVTLAGNGVTVSQAGQIITLGVSSGTVVYGNPGDATLLAAGYTEARPGAVDFWTPTSMVNAPSPRSGHTVVWTGSKMIVWGGVTKTNSVVSVTNTGAIYDPNTDTWTPMSMNGNPIARYGHTAVWTGTEMIVWGGLGPAYGCCALNTGHRYVLATDTWYDISSTNTPSARSLHTAVWTGSRMIVWGGNSNALGDLGDGGQYDRASDTWIATTSTNAPAARSAHVAVWTGTRMVLFGGSAGATGAQYFPGTTLGTDAWSFISTVNAPSVNVNASAVWTGSRMIVSYNDPLSSGTYDPLLNAWTPVAQGQGPHTGATIAPNAVWTGSRMLIWSATSGALVYQYDPTANVWAFSSTTGAPNSYGPAVWTGTRMIVWGGSGNSDYLDSGGQWRPLSLYIKN